VKFSEVIDKPASLSSAKPLLLTNYRPEYLYEWGRKTYYMQLRLAPLRQTEAEEGLAAVAEALRLVEKNDARFSEAEVYRIKGELTLQQESQKAKGKNGSRSLTPVARCPGVVYQRL